MSTRRVRKNWRIIKSVSVNTAKYALHLYDQLESISQRLIQLASSDSLLPKRPNMQIVPIYKPDVLSFLDLCACSHIIFTNGFPTEFSVINTSPSFTREKSEKFSQNCVELKKIFIYIEMRNFLFNKSKTNKTIGIFVQNKKLSCQSSKWRRNRIFYYLKPP